MTLNKGKGHVLGPLGMFLVWWAGAFVFVLGSRGWPGQQTRPRTWAHCRTGDLGLAEAAPDLRCGSPIVAAAGLYAFLNLRFPRHWAIPYDGVAGSVLGNQR